MQNKETETSTRAEVLEYLINRITCSGDCKYSSWCPHIAEGMAADDCVVRRDVDKVFNTWYALYLGGYDGLKAEMTGVAYRLKQQAHTPEEELQFFTSLAKIMQSCYQPERSSKSDEITEVILNITPVEGENASKGCSTKEVENE